MRFLKVFLASIVVLTSLTAKAQTTNYQVYSLFVVNIAKYSSWPDISGEFNITVFGKTKVHEELLKQNGKSVGGHSIKINQIENVADIGHAQILYLADGKSGSLDEILKTTQGKSIMIICEREGLFKKGAGFSFVIMENGTLRYDINNTELEKRQIKVSKNLTALANSSI
jgi:hypothetical protein